MPTGNNLQSPTEAPLVSPTSTVATADGKCDNGKVQMKKQLGLVEGTAIILGIIFGSGKRMNIRRIIYFFNNFFFFIHFDCRNFRFTKRSYKRGERSWNIAHNLGYMRIFINDRSFMLCRTWNINTSIRWRLCIYQWSVWRFSSLFIFMGCLIYFCVSEIGIFFCKIL